MTIPKALVVYYSETGHTRAAAAGIAAALDAGLDAIAVDDFRMPGFLGFFQRCWRAMRRKGARIRPPEESPEGYDVLIIGSPVWASRVTPPVTSYLNLVRSWQGPVAFFVTADNQGALAALADMAELMGRAPIARMTIEEKDRQNGDDREKIANFVTSIKSALE